MNYRQPTLQEAVEWIMKAQTKEYRRIQLQAWKLEFGEVFAGQVEQEVKARWKK